MTTITAFITPRMSISELLSTYRLQVEEKQEQLSNFLDSITAIDVINDGNLKDSPSTPKSLVSKSSSGIGLTRLDKSDTNLIELTISQLNEKKQNADNSLAELNNLWVLKGLIQETEILFNPNEESKYICDKYDLESIFQNLQKITTKLAAFSDAFIIKTELKDKLDVLNHKFNFQLLDILKLFVKDTEDEEFIIVQEIKVNDVELSLKEYLNLIETFIEYSNILELRQEFTELRLKWESEALNQLINKKKYLNLDLEDKSSTLSLTDCFPGDSFFCEYYFRSVANFVKFINSLEDEKCKQFYANKISNNLTNMISENITKLYNNDLLLAEFNNVLQLVQSTKWNLPITRSFSSSDKINEQLHGLYNNWVVDKYINQIRLYFDSKEFISDIKTFNDSNEQGNDGWDEPWSDDEDKPKEEEEDGWDEDWGDDNWGDDEEKPKETKKQKKVLESVKVSGVPEKLKVIVDEFKKETNGSATVDLILSAVLSFSLISYPSLKESFLFFNDFNHLGNLIGSSYLAASAESNWTQQSISNSNELFKILLSYKIESDADFKLPVEISQFFESLQSSQLKDTNIVMFKTLVIQLLEITSNWLVNTIIGLDEITEYQSEKFTKFIKYIQTVTADNLKQINEQPSAVTSSNKLAQTLLLINNHLKDIMEYFYNGELFDYSTQELNKIIENIFIKSDLRDNCIREIEEIRNAAD